MNITKQFLCILLGSALLGSSGCTSILSPVNGVPAHRLPEEFLARPKNNLVAIDISRLRQEPPQEYLLDAGDILGIYVQGVLGEEDQPPPIHMPTPDSDLPPAMGFPIPVRENGTLAMPLVDPIRVSGLTLQQVEMAIRRAYTVDRRILQPGQDRIIVTLMRPREYTIVVMRQDGGPTVSSVSSASTANFLSTRGQVVKLGAYKNDVLNALAETGGLPGAEARNEIKILRGRLADARRRDAFIQEFYRCPPADPCLCFPTLPDDPSVIRIPLRLPPGEIPRFDPSDIILRNGDIVLIEGRETEVFYTGGLLGGGEHPLPRDYDIDVLQAMAIVGGGIASSSNRGGGGGGLGGGFGGAGSVGGVPPGQLFILRKTACNDQITIAVDLNRAINDPKARPLVLAGDTLILQYKPQEEVLNFGLGTFFTFGISNLLRGNNN